MKTGPTHWGRSRSTLISGEGRIHPWEELGFPEQTDNERNHQKRQEDEKQNLRNAGGSPRNAAEPQKASHNRNH